MPNDTPSAEIIPRLARFEKSMHPIEKEIFYLLKDLSKKYPQKNLRELLDTQRKTHLRLLNRQQRYILDRLHFVGQFLPKKTAQKLENVLKEAEEILDDKTCNEQFKRRVFVGKITYSAMEFAKKDIAKTIIGIAEEMPKASNNISAFIVKHTEKNPATGAQRTSQGIVYALLAPSIGSVEHIKARSKNVKRGGGKDKMSNYILECARDNNERSSMPFNEFAKMHPEFFGKHLQRYMDKVIQGINSGKLTGYDKYPRQVAKTLEKESKGLVKVNISKLNIQNA